MLTTSWMDEATKIVNKLLSKKESEFLRDPVDWQALGLHDYPAIIKTPMDLKTVKKKLEMESYRDPTCVAADIRLIFLNAMTYNAPGSRIYSQAKNLSEYFESNCKGLFKNVEDVDKPANAEEMGAWVDKCHRSWYCLRIPELYYTLSSLTLHRISAVELKRILDFLDTNYPSCLVKVWM